MAVLSTLRGTLLSLCQLVLLIGLSPFVFWAVEALPRWAGGQVPLSPRFSARRGLSFWRALPRHALSAGEAVCLSVGLVAFLSLPGVVGTPVVVALADPLVMGTLILTGRCLLFSSAAVKKLLPGFPLLCLTEIILALAAPGMNGMEGMRAMMHVMPESGVAGASACCAVALAIACPVFRAQEITLALHGIRERPVREARRVIAEILETAWILFLADLLLPVTLGRGWLSGPIVGLGEALLKIGTMLLLLGGLRLTAQEHSARLTFLFIGLALLLALAGRFVT